MIAEKVDPKTAKRTIERNRCGECGSRLSLAWGGAFSVDGWVIRCSNNPNHNTMTREGPYIAKREGEVVMKEAEAETGLVYRESENLTLRPTEHMSIEQFDERQALIRHVVGQMQEGVHYGVIPGTRDKSLWEPGAEYLRAAFQIQWAYEVEEKIEDFVNHEYRYRIRAFQILANGASGPSWPAHAWSQEQRFAGGPGSRGMEKEMLPHNVMDRAVKRAFVALIRNVSGTTGYFKQSLDVTAPETAVKTTTKTPVVVRQTSSSRQATAPASLAITFDQLKAEVEASGMTWDKFEIEILRQSWERFIKVKDNNANVAKALWETWKAKQPQPAGAEGQEAEEEQQENGGNP